MADRSRCFGLKAVGNASLGVDRLSEAMSHSRRREDHAMELDEAEELEAEDALAVLRASAMHPPSPFSLLTLLTTRPWGCVADVDLYVFPRCAHHGG